MSEPPLLQLADVSLSFGGLKAVAQVNLDLPRGQLHGLIGPNGAGKTTIFNLITGVYRPDHGAITLAGKRLHGLKPWKIAKSGVARTFQNIRLFPDLSVLDNVRVACHLRTRHNLLATMLHTRGQMTDERFISHSARRLLEIFHLGDRRHEPAGSLPYGDQRRLEIARALALGPKLLLLDEPAAGMNRGEKADLALLIRRLRDEFDLTMLMIEHDMGLIMNICDRITVLDYGQVIAGGTAQQVQRDPKVIEAYLGEPLPAAGSAGAGAGAGAADSSVAAPGADHGPGKEER